MRLAAAATAIAITFVAVPAYAVDAGTKPDAKVEAPTSQPNMPNEVPENVEEAMQMAQKGIDYLKAKNWWGFSAVAIFILMFILKIAKVFEKIGKRWAYVIVPGLSLIAMLLAKFAGDLSWGAAVAVLTSGPAMAALSDLVKRGILGKEHKTPVKPS